MSDLNFTNTFDVSKNHFEAGLSRATCLGMLWHVKSLYRKSGFVPRLHPSIMNSVFYLYRSEADARAGTASGGTGFLVGVPITKELDKWQIYAVTNRHIVCEHGASVFRFNLRIGGTEIIESNPDQWTLDNQHDLAVMPIALDFQALDATFFPIEIFIDEATCARQDIAPGDEAFMIGRFVHHDGRLQNKPSVRHGILSMINDLIDNPVYRYRREDSFAVDIRAQGGYSGSPVLVLLSDFDIRNNSFATNRGVLLLGITWGVINDHEQVLEKIVPANKQTAQTNETTIRYVPINTGISAVVPSWHIRSLLDSPHFLANRQAEKKKIISEEGESRGGVSVGLI